MAASSDLDRNYWRSRAEECRSMAETFTANTASRCLFLSDAAKRTSQHDLLMKCNIATSAMVRHRINCGDSQCDDALSGPVD